MANVSTPLRFPCLMCFGSRLFALTADEFTKALAPTYRGNFDFRFKLLPSPTGHHPPRWILESSGRIRMITCKSIVNSWAIKLRWLWDFTRAHCEVSEPISTKVSEFLVLLAELKDSGSPPRVRLARSVVASMPSDELLDERVFRLIWKDAGFDVADAEWGKTFPSGANGTRLRL